MQVFAQGLVNEGANPIAELDPIIGNIISTIIPVAGVVLFVILIIGGFLYLTAGGVPERVERAKKTITFGIIGVVLIALAFFIIGLVSAFTGVNILNFSTQVERPPLSAPAPPPVRPGGGTGGTGQQPPPGGGGTTQPPTNLPPSGGNRGPQANPPIPAGAIRIRPDQSIQAFIDDNPAGTTYVLERGNTPHRILPPQLGGTGSIRPKPGDTFIGENGAIVSGAQVFTSFIQEGGQWYINVANLGLRPDNRFPGGLDAQGLSICEVGYSRCTNQHDLFINDTPLRHVESRSQLSTIPNSFYFDYNSGRVYFNVNPNGRNVELSVTEQFVNSSVANLTFRNLIVEKFANRTQTGAINGPGANWVIDNNEFRLNHAQAIKWAAGWRVTDNYSHDNGHMGAGGIGNNMVIENNEFANNGYARYKLGWESGGFKLARSTGVVIRNNYSHNNWGPGIWIDIDNRNITIEGNTTEWNATAGIKYELSYEGIIRNNTSRFNGSSPRGGLLGAQIEIHNSSGVDVYGNTLEVHANFGDGLVVYHSDRGKYVTDNNDLYGNTVRYNGTNVGGTTDGHSGAQITAATYLNRDRNRFRNNTYQVPNTGLTYFRWSTGSGNIAWSEFQRLSGENGTIIQR